MRSSRTYYQSILLIKSLSYISQYYFCFTSTSYPIYIYNIWSNSSLRIN
nr:MAG TPA: hypothetical protein [Caudoviricetes sp.]